MINLPPWLVFLVAFWVIVFGVFRLYIAKNKLKNERLDEENPRRPNFRRGGLYAQSRRRHIVFGFAYLALGVVLIAMGFGVRFPTLSSCQADKASEAKEAGERPALKKEADKKDKQPRLNAMPVGN